MGKLSVAFGKRKGSKKSTISASERVKEVLNCGSKSVPSAFDFEFTLNYETEFEFMKLNILFFKIK